METSLILMSNAAKMLAEANKVDIGEVIDILEDLEDNLVTE